MMKNLEDIKVARKTKRLNNQLNQAREKDNYVRLKRQVRRYNSLRFDSRHEHPWWRAAEAIGGNKELKTKLLLQKMRFA